MFITDRVKMALTVVPSRFTLDSFDTYFNASGKVGALTRAQLSKAIRSQKHVKALGNGKYKIKGRRVFP